MSSPFVMYDYLSAVMQHEAQKDYIFLSASTRPVWQGFASGVFLHQCPFQTCNYIKRIQHQADDQICKYHDLRPMITLIWDAIAVRCRTTPKFRAKKKNTY